MRIATPQNAIARSFAGAVVRGSKSMVAKSQATVFNTVEDALFAKGVLSCACWMPRAYWPDAITIVDTDNPSQRRSDELHELFQRQQRELLFSAEELGEVK